MDDRPRDEKPTNMRAFRRATELRLTIAVVLFLTVIGSALVWLFFGGQVALAALGCSLFGAVLFALLYGGLALLERWNNRLWR